MANVTQSSYSQENITVWLRGLLSLAWADGHFDPEEEQLITSLIHQNLSEEEKTKTIEPISAEELAAVLKPNPTMAEDFLRMAVMVALVDGEYSASEDNLLRQYCEALGLKPEALTLLQSTLQTMSETPESAASLMPEDTLGSTIDPLYPVRDWMDGMSIQDPKLARLICKMIPPQCPFERDVMLFGRKVAHIPALCKLNPLYDQFVGLRFRALSYLADDCGEDISEYC
jgi:tellurite resistance protein